MGLQSLDQVSVGDWLVCDCGPKIAIRSPFSEEIEYRRDKEMEGVLVHVLAINPPIVLAEAFTLNTHKTFPITINFNDAGWSRANTTYKDEYLKIRKLGRQTEVKE